MRLSGRSAAAGKTPSVTFPDISNAAAIENLTVSERRSIMPIRQSEGIWEGTLKNGQGKMRIGTGGFEVDYSFPSRFENGIGTNPEELLGAAHAGCYSMALSQLIAKAGYTPKNIHTRAKVHLDQSVKGLAISRMELDTTADIPDMDEQAFMDLAEKAKTNCPVSRALTGVDISLEARLEQDAGSSDKQEPDFNKAPADTPPKTGMPK
jgi:osmotically inducible protein OsmC